MNLGNSSEIQSQFENSILYRHGVLVCDKLLKNNSKYSCTNAGNNGKIMIEK